MPTVRDSQWALIAEVAAELGTTERKVADVVRILKRTNQVITRDFPRDEKFIEVRRDGIPIIAQALNIETDSATA